MGLGEVLETKLDDILMEILGRDEDKKLMQRLLQSNESKFLAIYGRRRVGKTYLIRSVYETQIIFECVGIYEGEKSEQLENFWLKLNEKTSKTTLQPKTWLKAFNQLSKYIDTLRSKKKKVIFLDEISWYDTARSGFVGALANFWNSYCSKRNDIILVICGSAASWIIDKVVSNRGGLHNRLNHTIQLEPFNLNETKAYLLSKKVKLSDKDLMTLYMCIGGIPYYLNGVQPGKSIAQIADSLFFNNKSYLKYEFDNLYAALFKNHQNHVAIINALAKKNKGLTRSEVSKATKINSGGALSTLLYELESCGFIQKTYDIDKKKEDGLYRLMDEYSIFYIKFIKNSKGKTNTQALFASPSLKSWMGFAFENLCFKHISQIAEALGISGINYHGYSFLDKGRNNSQGAQIDLVIDRADNCMNVLELKYYNDTYKMTSTEMQKIRQRVNSLIDKTKTKKSVFVTMISPFGCEKNEHYLSIATNEILGNVLFEK